MTAQLNLVSFNCRGLLSSEDYIRLIAEQADILTIQEHWLVKEQFGVLRRVGDEFNYTAISPMESSRPIQGRPY